MAKIWREPLDPRRHVDHFHAGNAHPREPAIGAYAYFVTVAGFTFEFASIAQIREALAWFSIKIHPSSREPGHTIEKGEWQPWHSRLPATIKKSSKRARVIRALTNAVAAFGA